jgi:hypothetical protein
MKNLEEVITTVAGLCDYTKNFHLSKCGGCDLPSWQQPCPVCNWYPYYGQKEYNEKQRKAIQNSNYTEEGWVIKHDRKGNIALWVLAGARETLAWGTSYMFRQNIKMAEFNSAAVDWPSGEELMAMYKKSRALQAIKKNPGDEEAKALLMEIGDSECTTAVREADTRFAEENNLSMETDLGDDALYHPEKYNAPDGWD